MNGLFVSLKTFDGPYVFGTLLMDVEKGGFDILHEFKLSYL